MHEFESSLKKNEKINFFPLSVSLSKGEKLDLYAHLSLARSLSLSQEVLRGPEF